MHFGVAVAVAVNRNDAVRVFRHYIAIGIHAEGTHHVIIKRGTVQNFCLIHLVGDMLEHLCRHLHTHADIHLIIDKIKAHLSALLCVPFRTGAAGSGNQILAGNLLALVQLQHKGSVLLTADFFNRGIAADFNIILQKLMDVFHNHEVVFRTQMAYLGVQQMQVVFQRLHAYFAVLGRKIFTGSTMTAVQLINIINQLDNLVLRQIFVQPAAEFRRKIIFAVRKSTGTAKAAHNAAGAAVNAVINLLGCQRAEALFNRIAGLQHNNLHLRILQHKLIGCKNCGRTATDNSYIIHKFSSLLYPIKKPQPHFFTAVYQLIAVVPVACADSLAAVSRC